MIPIPYGRQWIDDDDIAAVVECLRGDWLTQGPAVDRFEQALCQATGAKYAVAVSSGTAALHLAAIVAGVGPGDTGITSAITFTASANCIEYCGGKAHFADVDPKSALMCLQSLEERIQQLTRAGKPPKVIIPVDFAGQPCNLPAIRTIADRCGAKVIEDAAHSLGASYSYGGKTFRTASCVHSDLAILSFHPVKHVTTGEGGALLTSDPTMASRARDLRSHGIHKDQARLTRPDEGPWYYEQTELGLNYRLTDLQCALGLSQLRKLGRFLERRNEIAKEYDRALATSPLSDWLTPLKQQEYTITNAYHLYVVRLTHRPDETLEQLAERRKSLYLALRERNIAAQVHYIPVPMQPHYRNRPSKIDGALAYYHSCLSLPMFPKMTDGEVGCIIEALIEIRNIGV